MMGTVTNSDPSVAEAGCERPDFLHKCENYGRMIGGRRVRPCDIQAAGLYVYFEVFEGREGCGPGEVWLEGRKVLMFGSNDYLDLITHPKVLAAAVAAVHQYGTGCSGSRLLNGTLDLHVKLEAELAQLMGKEDAMTFGTGFQSNYAAIAGLTDRGDVLICDHNIHASLVDGALRTDARILRFRHNDAAHLESLLRGCSGSEPVMVVTESLFSMEGDQARLDQIVPLSKKYGARIYLDEAHGIGVFGRTGAGLAEEIGVLPEIDVVMGTFSKSLASVGGFVASSKSVIEYLKHECRPFVFSASLPAPSVAAVLAALEVMKEEPERQRHVRTIARELRRALTDRGYWVLEAGETPIVPIVVPEPMALFQLCRMLLEEGIYVNPVVKPAASHNLLRISCTAAHSSAHVERLVETLGRVAERLDLDLTAH